MQIADRQFNSRLLIGTAHYPDRKTLQEAIIASGAEIVTVAIRRVQVQDSILSDLPDHLLLLPNTAGCFTAKEAVLTAELAREALGTNWIKLEVIGDDKTLLPDLQELLKAAEELVRKDFIVLPYCTDDLMTCLKLEDLGCSAIMPLGSPIGSGMGILNPYALELLRQAITLPLILDAGIGTASDAVMAFELGFDGVLLNSAIARALNPVLMAQAMNAACQAGRAAYLAGRISKKDYAIPSSPTEGVISI